MVGYRLLLFLANNQVVKILWHFEISTWESMGKPKMWNTSIWKMANRRVKQMKIWESWSYSAHL